MNVYNMKKLTIVLITFIVFSTLVFFGSVYFSDEQIKTKLNKDVITITHNQKTITKFNLKDISYIGLYEETKSNEGFNKGSINIASSFFPSRLCIKIYLKGQNPVVLNYSSTSKTIGTFNYLSAITKNL
ncbi:MAG: hypothetical protein RR898_02735 [Clostridium sp.]|uniref:hypothetical protein n=1 Tax=Clostridium sp. TaxID=1506 RepID=UPI002FC856E6